MPFSLRSEEHTSELQSRSDLVCRLLLEKKTAVLPRTGRPPRGGRVLPKPGARDRPQHRGVVHAGAGEGDPGPPAGSRQDDRKGGLRLDGRQRGSHSPMTHGGRVGRRKGVNPDQEKGKGWEPFMKGWDARLQPGKLPSGLPQSVER